MGQKSHTKALNVFIFKDFSHFFTPLIAKLRTYI